MVPRTIREYTLQLEKIVGGGQALGVLDDGRKAFVWGGLPGETVTIRETKHKSNYVEGVVIDVQKPSPERIEPLDPESYLSTSPWQIMTFDAEQHYKAALILEAFELHNVQLPGAIDVFSDNVTAHYRNKVEFSWYGAASPQEYEVGSMEYESATGEASREVVSSERHLQPEFQPSSRASQAGDARRGSTHVEQSETMGRTERQDPRDSEQRDNSNDVVDSRAESARYASTDATGSVETLDIAFFRRGSKGKIVVENVSLLPESMTRLAHDIRDFLHAKHVSARQLKTLLIRCDQAGNCAWQLYVKDEDFNAISDQDAAQFDAQGGEVIYSDPRSPASRITKRLLSVGNPVLSDTVLGVPFRYATEGFFQVNIPVYEQALRDMREWTSNNRPPASEPREDVFSERHLQPRQITMNAREMTGAKPSEENMSSEVSGHDDEKARGTIVDLYSGVGSIGLTIGGDNCTLIEIDEHAVREMKRNIAELHSNAKAVLAPAEKALEYITQNATIILDPPRAGLHADVTAKLLEAAPPRIIYLSCNPVTQARDVALLAEKYKIVHHRGYNFFPRTPHIEHLVVLDKA